MSKQATKSWIDDWDKSHGFKSKDTGRIATYPAKTEPLIKLCRHKPTMVFQTKQGVKFYGASKQYIDAMAVKGMDLVVSLLGHPELYEEPTIEGDSHWMELNEYLEQDLDTEGPEELVIHWRDQDVLAGDRKFWLKFYDLIREKGYKKVLFFCFGGHGRTGTALASMMTVTLDIHGGRAIQAVRDSYCKEAVESKKQADYVRGLTKKNGEHK